MFDALTDKFSSVFRNLSGRGKISEENIRESMREVRTALLEADVNFKVVNDFTDHVIQKAIGQDVIKSLQPGQLMVKIVYDELVNLMGPVDTNIYFVQPPPTVIEQILINRAVAPVADTIEINSGQENIEIAYTGLSLTRPEQIKFKYKLEGLDSDWINAGIRHTAYYSYSAGRI